MESSSLSERWIAARKSETCQSPNELDVGDVVGGEEQPRHELWRRGGVRMDTDAGEN